VRLVYVIAGIAVIGFGITIGIATHSERHTLELEQTKTAKCVLSALQNTPGIREPTLTYEVSSDGTRPLVTFSTIYSGSWTGSSRSDLKGSDAKHYYLQVIYVGGSVFDHGLEGVVVNRWKERCGLETKADVEIN
jgi:hypothetical protein